MCLKILFGGKKQNLVFARKKETGREKKPKWKNKFAPLHQLKDRGGGRSEGGKSDLWKWVSHLIEEGAFRNGTKILQSSPEGRGSIVRKFNEEVFSGSGSGGIISNRKHYSEKEVRGNRNGT